MPEESTLDSRWSAEEPGATPESVAETSEAPPEDETRGTRAERRSARDQSTRDDNVRTERDEARTRAERAESALTAMRDSTIRERVAEHLANPDDLAFVTTAEERAELWDEDGTLDEGALAAAIDRVLEERPHWRKSKTSRGMDMNSGGGRAASGRTRSVGWADVLRGNVG